MSEIKYKIENDNKTSTTETNSYNKMIKIYKDMAPFIKGALNQIYLRQSTLDTEPDNISLSKSLYGNAEDDQLSRQFEKLNVDETSKESLMAKKHHHHHHQKLPRITKFLLISAYIATHNPAKYDRKLFDYNSVVKSRRSKYTAAKIQQNEDNQRAAALKAQAFDINRLLAIFASMCTEHSSDKMRNINLSSLQRNIQTLKSLHLLQQTNGGAYSSLDEPKFKCLLDFDTINQFCLDLKINIKQYLVEFCFF
jgi:hypothetical protein